MAGRNTKDSSEESEDIDGCITYKMGLKDCPYLSGLR